MRISGITIPDNKRIEMALTVIFGIGRSRAHKILDEAKVEYGKMPKDLTTDEENTIRKIIEDNFTIEGNLKRTVSANISFHPTNTKYLEVLYVWQKRAIFVLYLLSFIN